MENQSGIIGIRVHFIIDEDHITKNYVVPVTKNPEVVVQLPPLQDDQISWDMNFEKLSKACDELNSIKGPKDPSMTFRVYQNATELFSENATDSHVFGMDFKEAPIRQNLKCSFAVSLESLNKICARMKKSKGQQQKTIKIRADSHPESYVHFYQHLNDQIVFEWWLAKRPE